MGTALAIIDDEQHCVDRLLYLLAPHGGAFDIMVYTSLEEAQSGLERQRPKIVFLDVQLGGRSGFELLIGSGFRDFGLIFTTAYEKYAIAAFRCSAMAYLLKPVDPGEFEQALQRAMEEAHRAQLQERLELLLSHLSRENGPKRLSIPHREGYIFPLIDDILRCRADVNYTHIHCVDGKRYTASKTLKYFEELLPQPQFFRIHNSHLVNLDHVTAYDRNGYAILMDGSRLEVSTRKKEAFIKAIGRP